MKSLHLGLDRLEGQINELSAKRNRLMGEAANRRPSPETEKAEAPAPTHKAQEGIAKSATQATGLEQHRPTSVLDGIDEEIQTSRKAPFGKRLLEAFHTGFRTGMEDARNINKENRQQLMNESLANTEGKIASFKEHIEEGRDTTYKNVPDKVLDEQIAHFESIQWQIHDDLVKKLSR